MCFWIDCIAVLCRSREGGDGLPAGHLFVVDLPVAREPGFGESFLLFSELSQCDHGPDSSFPTKIKLNRQKNIANDNYSFFELGMRQINRQKSQKTRFSSIKVKKTRKSAIKYKSTLTHAFLQARTRSFSGFSFDHKHHTSGYDGLSPSHKAKCYDGLFPSLKAKGYDGLSPSLRLKATTGYPRL